MSLLPNATNQYVQVDDFDSIITYADQSQWTTPNPQDSLPFNQSATPYREGTYHLTNVVNASFTLDFEGPSITIHGASGPSFGSYEVSIDGNSTVSSAQAPQNTTFYLLYKNESMTYDNHTLKVTNLGARSGDNGGSFFLFDVLELGVQIAPPGATVVNTTVEETDPRLIYTGNWTTNIPNPAFSGGGSKYTNSDGSTVTLKFNGSAIYIFGDKVDDHGLFNVTLDNRTPQQFDGVSGCGGAFAKFCEKTNTLAYFASNLDSSEHTVTIRNVAGVNNSFFDLDSFVFSTPSEYSVRSPPTGGSSPGSSSSGGSTGSKSSSTPRAAVPGINFLLLLLFGVALVTRWSRR